jgi:hypothetical protein
VRAVSSYGKLDAEELRTELDSVVAELGAAYVELSAVKVQYVWLFLQGYKGSHETSVSGRDRDGECAAAAVKEDELKLEGQIASLTVVRDHLVNLLTWRTSGG